MYYKSIKFYENRWNCFSENKHFKFFPNVNYPSFWGRGNICKRTPHIEFEQDWSVGLGATLRDRQKIKNYFCSFKDFPGNADSVIFLGFECTINSQNLNKIVRAIFEKIEILSFFLCELPLILGVTRKRKEQTEYICKGSSNIDFEQDWLVGLGAILVDGQEIKNIFF